ncbi:MAG TPA: hypothetical protein VJA26_07135 [Gammaproteobacteria bacterium]|nr:hypothetical protein [Gammaproteobacteria bacterium]
MKINFQAIRPLLLAIVFGSAAVAIAGCERGPLEDAADDVGDAIEDAGDAIEDAADDVADEVEDAADEVEDRLN